MCLWGDVNRMHDPNNKTTLKKGSKTNTSPLDHVAFVAMLLLHLRFVHIRMLKAFHNFRKSNLEMLRLTSCDEAHNA